MFKMDCVWKLFKTIMQCSYSSTMFSSLCDVLMLLLLFSLFVKPARVNFFHNHYEGQYKKDLP